jgi:clan AA aspartic protease (TIGR02281 family)
MTLTRLPRNLLAQRAPFRTLAVGSLVGIVVVFQVGFPNGRLLANQDADIPAAAYSDEVVSKAEKILLENGLRRVGSQIQTTSQVELTRLFSDETKLARALRLSAAAWEESKTQLLQIEQQMEMLEVQVGQMNAQYAAVGNPQGRNNDLVARINAASAQLKQLMRARDSVKETVAEKKNEAGAKEEEYAELVLKMRRLVDGMKETVRTASEVRDVGIALQVLATRHSSPTEMSMDAMTSPLDRRLRKLEEAVFSESIPLTAERGALTVQAVIGLEPVDMLIDSGASIILIPQELAEKLGIKAEADAKSLNLKTADGRTIAAKQIFLPRLRVGKFEAENVKAALLEESVPGAKPLLGMSFLERFKFEIDTAQKTLSLLKVETPKP